MAETIHLLREDHVTMAELLDGLEAQLTRLDAEQQPDFQAMRDLLDYSLTFGAFCHHRREDLVLGKLRQRGVALPLALRRLEDDHESLGSLTNRFLETIYGVLQGEQAADESFAAIGRDFLDTYREHMVMEEKLFFPLAVEHLSAEDWAELDAQTTDPDNRFFGIRAKQHFESLRKALTLPGGGEGR